MEEQTFKRKIKMKKRENENVTFVYEFEDMLNPETISNILNELIKHCLFLRYQIPQPFVLLMNEVTADDGSCPPRKKQSRQLLKKIKFMEGICSICDCLTEIVKSNEVKIVSILFGSTLVSPKETFIIDLDFPVRSDVFNENPKRTCRKLFREIVTDEKLNGLKKLNPCNIFVILQLSNPLLQTESNVFIPKLNFILPNRGAYHYLKLSDRTSKLGDEKYKSSDDIFLDKLKMLNVRDDPCYWYAANIPLHGFKDIATKQSESSWI